MKYPRDHGDRRDQCLDLIAIRCQQRNDKGDAPSLANLGRVTLLPGATVGAE